MLCQRAFRFEQPSFAANKHFFRATAARENWVALSKPHNRFRWRKRADHAVVFWLAHGVGHRLLPPNRQSRRSVQSGIQRCLKHHFNHGLTRVSPSMDPSSLAFMACQ
jgi:hypothetical protein